jgi:hypothetical protein
MFSVSSVGFEKLNYLRLNYHQGMHSIVEQGFCVTSFTCCEKTCPAAILPEGSISQNLPQPSDELYEA